LKYIFQHVKITKQTPKNPRITEEDFWECRNNGGASSPCAAIIGGARVHAPSQENPEKQRDLERFPPHITFSTGDEEQCHLQKQQNHNKQSIRSSLFLGLLFFPSSSDGRSAMEKSTLGGGRW
jgi:hypothetical protein